MNSNIFGTCCRNNKNFNLAYIFLLFAILITNAVATTKSKITNKTKFHYSKSKKNDADKPLKPMKYLQHDKSFVQKSELTGHEQSIYQSQEKLSALDEMNAEMTTAAIVNFVLLKLSEERLGLTKAKYLSTIKVTVK